METQNEDSNNVVNQLPRSPMSRQDATATRNKLRSQFHRDGKRHNKLSDSMARDVLRHAQQIHSDSQDIRSLHRRKANALAGAVMGVSVPVLNSLTIRPSVQVQTGYTAGLASGETDFVDICIRINENAYNPDDIENVRAFITMLKGVLYHEGGHVLWSDPFREIQDPEYRPSETFYTSPILAKAFPELVKTSIDREKLMFAWNMLEDQRMETAMCSVSPVLAKYFTNIVVNIVIDRNRVGSNWPIIAGRTYLPQQLRQDIYDNAFSYMARTNPSLSEDEINTVITKTTDCVLKYRDARDRADMWKCVLEMAEYLPMWLPNSKYKSIDRHEGRWGDYDRKDPSSLPRPVDHTMEKRSPLDSDGSSKLPGGSESGGSTAPATYAGFESYLHKDIVNDREVAQFISSVNENLSKKILSDPTIRDMESESISRAIGVREQILSVLEQLTVQVDPSWRFGKETGVLDPTSYILREPGDTDYWSGLDDSGSSGHDLAISLLIDSSGSMGNDMDTVSEIAMGVRSACDQLEIPCTITSFNDTVFSVMEAGEDTRFVSIASHGGTCPMHALLNLNDQQMGRESHLVIILTDGEWNDVESLIPWSAPNRFFLLIGYGYGLELTLSKKHANHSIEITDLNEIEKLITNSLVEYFAK